MEIRSRFALAAALAYLWVMMILLGAIVLETFMVYPNIFHDPPRSLELAMQFMSVRGPDDVFPPLGFLSWTTGAAALALAWRDRPTRRWLLLSLGCIVVEGVVSILFFWPRNEVLFVEGLAVHSADALRQTAREFVALHWVRLASNGLASAAAFAGFTTLYRRWVLASATRQGAEPAAHGQDSPIAAT